MSSKRSTKKHVRYTCGDLASECILAKTFIPGVKAEDMAAIVIEVARLQENTLRKASIATSKEAFHALITEFNQGVAAIVKQMNAALPQEQKDLNKKAK